MVNESSAFLWHKRFGHISKERLQRLVKNKILPNLDFTDFGLCVECIKAKQTKHNKKGATRSDDLLEIIHTDICGPFDTSSFSREKYLITFIDDFSRYGYVYLPHEKSQSINALEVFINEVERQQDRKVKIFECHTHSQLDGKYLVKKIADVKDSLKRVRKAICEMESKSDKEAWTDSLDCFKDNKTRLEVKLSRLTQLEYENAEGVKELKVHSAIMELCKED
ncbi:retrovirus-related pol polyprotein from transposon TNT 1-94 [Tanacetum coccineum]|uniref:Retrovirus-related pol polyprotein from transposon TNT 1-94 n=1 Tax=Tanacetum coccineum TaxID=301880 RepID=A0ABQ5EX34_9ASTR